jgi:hypothetical protein
MKLRKSELFGWSRDWPTEISDAPQELIQLIEDALIDFGPDRHCDGAEEIAALVWDAVPIIKAATDPAHA